MINAAQQKRILQRCLPRLMVSFALTVALVFGAPVVIGRAVSMHVASLAK